MNELEKCMAGEYYDCHDRIFLDFKAHARDLLKELAKRLTPDWTPGSEQYFCRTYALPITIGSGCWLGGGVIVLPGVSIGDGCVIGAGSVVTKDIPANSLAVGNPCRVIRRINEKAGNAPDGGF